jgi:hypothetical protein
MVDKFSALKNPGKQKHEKKEGNKALPTDTMLKFSRG